MWVVEIAGNSVTIIGGVVDVAIVADGGRDLEIRSIQRGRARTTSWQDFAAQAAIALEITRRERELRKLQIELARANRMATMELLSLASEARGRRRIGAAARAHHRESLMIGRVAALLYGVASYLVFLLSFVYAVAFIGNYPVPKSIDSGLEGQLALSMLTDLVLLGAFAVQHSVMARPSFKRWWTRIVPQSCERSTYVLVSSLLLILIFWQWRPIPATICVEGWPAALLIAAYWIGWLIALTSTWMIDHLELFGLRQVFDTLRGTASHLTPLKTPLLYRFVRHPLMLGFLIAFWTTPHMTAGHLVLRS
jgi:protein-S-isoprenylcysteine O-methyltransferase Ste14